ncbi:MAG: hypothetical protein II458_00400 [Oscillospiraceae bacterium]|nr:hypothetical protein [Oscillospiraceae bacterium]
MNKSTKERRHMRLVCMILVAALLIPMTVCRVHAAGTKKATRRSIAIVFDNSFSMYMNGETAWCNATYAMEVFASMMNEGDTLMIYPMHPITAEGTEYTEDSPLVIRSASDVAKIRDIYTLDAQDTPITTLDRAYEGLARESGADQKWLIVLTDGTNFNDEENREMSVDETQEVLSQRLGEFSNAVNVMYLGIGGSKLKVPSFSSDTGLQTYVTRGSGDKVLPELTAMCNMIFGRNELRAGGNNVSFDLPMTQLIVFVQGANISDISLINEAGQPVTRSWERATRYSEKGCGRHQNPSFAAVPDTNLQGALAAFPEVDAGQYTLSYTGSAQSVTVYYEPEVDLVAYLEDEFGARYVDGDEVHPGKYTVKYGLVDKEHNFTSSSLLKDIDYKITCYKNGTPEEIQSKKAGSFDLVLDADDKLDITAAASYLDGYYIEKNAAELGWPLGGFDVIPRPAGSLELKLAGDQEVFKLSELESGSFDVTLVYDGEVLSGADLDKVELKPGLTGGNAGCVAERTEDGFRINLRFNGTAAETEPGTYTLTASATYTNEDGQVAESNEASREFQVDDDGFTLSIDLDIQQHYFELRKMGSGKPIIAHLSKDGTPLSPEEFAAISFVVEGQSGEPFSAAATPLPDQSAYEIRLDPGADWSTGFHHFVCRAAGTDPVGHELAAQASGSVEIQRYPVWLRWLIGFLVAALLTALILSYLNAKVLPKGVTVKSGSTKFNVDSNKVGGNAIGNLSGGGKKHGSLELRGPRANSYPLAKGGFVLTVEAKSPRRVKSSNRGIHVKSLDPVNASTVTMIQIGTVTYRKDPQTNKFLPTSKSAQTGGFDISNNAQCTVSGTTVEGTSFYYTCNLKFL